MGPEAVEAGTEGGCLRVDLVGDEGGGGREFERADVVGYGAGGAG